MNFKLFDLYSDYLLSSFSLLATTATGMSALMGKAISHDQISRMLNQRQLEPADWWQMVKPSVRSLCKALVRCHHDRRQHRRKALHR